MKSAQKVLILSSCFFVMGCDSSDDTQSDGASRSKVEDYATEVKSISLIHGLNYQKRVIKDDLDEIQNCIHNISQVEFPPGVQVSPPPSIAWEVQIHFQSSGVSDTLSFFLLEDRGLSGVTGGANDLTLLEDWLREKIAQF